MFYCNFFLRIKTFSATCVKETHFALVYSNGSLFSLVRLDVLVPDFNRNHYMDSLNDMVGGAFFSNSRIFLI